jgi:hypothetical protein
MHASIAYVNGAGLKRRKSTRSGDGDSGDGNELKLLNTLLSTATAQSPALKKGKLKDEHQAKEQSKHHTAAKPGD